MSIIVCKSLFCFLFPWWQLQLLKAVSYLLAGTYFIFLKNVLDTAWKSFDSEFAPQSKDRKSSYQIGQNLALFCNLGALFLR